MTLAACQHLVVEWKGRRPFQACRGQGGNELRGVARCGCARRVAGGTACGPNPAPRAPAAPQAQQLAGRVPHARVVADPAAQPAGAARPRLVAAEWLQAALDAGVCPMLPLGGPSKGPQPGGGSSSGSGTALAPRAHDQGPLAAREKGVRGGKLEAAECGGGEAAGPCSPGAQAGDAAGDSGAEESEGAPDDPDDPDDPDGERWVLISRPPRRRGGAADRGLRLAPRLVRANRAWPLLPRPWARAATAPPGPAAGRFKVVAWNKLATSALGARAPLNEGLSPTTLVSRRRHCRRHGAAPQPPAPKSARLSDLCSVPPSSRLFSPTQRQQVVL
jgi:hypothetical protein